MTNFEHLWKEAKHKYSYFEYKGVDWDQVYDMYRPRVREDMTEQELFEVLADMLYELKDGHVNLSSSFDRSRNWSWYLDFDPDFDESIVYREYLGDDYRITGPLHNQVIDSVLYVYYNSFGNTIDEKHIEHLVERSKGMKGMIFHPGGSSAYNQGRESGSQDPWCCCAIVAVTVLHPSLPR